MLHSRPIECCTIDLPPRESEHGLTYRDIQHSKAPQSTQYKLSHPKDNALIVIIIKTVEVARPTLNGQQYSIQAFPPGVYSKN